MRTTLNIDDDVLDRARALAQKTRRPFKTVVNEALRAGLASDQIAPKCKPYKTRARNMGLRPGINLDNIAEVIAIAEGEDYK
jgi:hypothetical protein